jgi:iron complex transport system ATP-binding protein
MPAAMLRCTGLTLAVSERVLCRDVALTFRPGEVWAVLGRNGTGKSTLMHALAGLTRPQSGCIELDGAPVFDMDGRERARRLGVLPQLEEGTFWGNATEYVLLGRFPHASRWSGFDADDVRKAHAALDTVGMGAFAGQAYVSLSGGERQRVRIAQIVAQEPGIVLLDEPLQHLDLAHQALVIELVRSRARKQDELAIMVLHEPLWIGSACTHALIFAGDGTVEAGPVDALLTREKLERAYGCRLREIEYASGRCFVPDV